MAEKFCFCLEIGLFLSERYNFVLFSPTCGNIYWFLAVFLEGIVRYVSGNGCIRNLSQQVFHLLGLQLV